MKKRRLLQIGLLIFAGSIFAQSGLSDIVKNLNALDATKLVTAKINIPEEKELFPYLYSYVQGLNNVNDPKMLFIEAKFQKTNIIDDYYEIFLRYVYKFGVGFQSKEYKVMIFKNENGELNVGVPDIYTFPIDAKGKHTGKGIESNQKIKNQYTNDLAASINTYIKAFSEKDYNDSFDLAFGDINIQLEAAALLQNKLKIKKWYKDHDITGKTVNANFVISSIDESNVEGFDYEIQGIQFNSKLESTKIIYLSNNEKLIDKKEGEEINIKGLTKEVVYSSIDNKISKIIIEE